MLELLGQGVGREGAEMIYIPGLEPDFDTRQELKFIGKTLDLRHFDKVFISLSGGRRGIVLGKGNKQGAAL
jgi:hypothetical protein